MEPADARSVSCAETIAVGATALFTGVRTPFELRFRQVAWISNTFGGSGNVLTGAGHR